MIYWFFLSCRIIKVSNNFQLHARSKQKVWNFNLKTFMFCPQSMESWSDFVQIKCCRKIFYREKVFLLCRTTSCSTNKPQKIDNSMAKKPFSRSLRCKFQVMFSESFQSRSALRWTKISQFISRLFEEIA